MRAMESDRLSPYHELSGIVEGTCRHPPARNPVAGEVGEGSLHGPTGLKDIDLINFRCVRQAHTDGRPVRQQCEYLIPLSGTKFLLVIKSLQ